MNHAHYTKHLFNTCGLGRNHKKKTEKKIIMKKIHPRNRDPLEDFSPGSDWLKRRLGPVSVARNEVYAGRNGTEAELN